MKIIKICFAIMLFVCLFDMPYGYYQLIRILALCLFGYLSYENFKNGYKTAGIIYLFLAILFQPLLKISLGRTLWNIVDIIVGIGLIVDAFRVHKNN